jgi:rare lipoprotein A
MYSMTAAHKTLPLPTYVRVTHLQNGRSVIVKVNDRGPFHDDRLIDLSYAAASKLGITSKGTGVVEVVAIDPRTYLANKDKTTPKKNRSNTPASTPLEYSLYLQAGAFVSRVNAEQLQTKLQALYNTRKITSAYSTEKQVYRVRIGPIASVEEADKLAQDINFRGLDRPHIVID